MGIQAIILNQRPSLSFAAAELVLATLSLGPSPRFMPLVLLLAVLRIHGQRIAFRPTRVLELMCSWLVVTIGSSLAHWTAAAQALSSPLQSIWAITFLSAVTYTCAVLAFYLEIRFTGHVKSIWSQLTLFPALWVMLWAIASHVSPVGRLLNWSPTSTSHSYNWVVPFLGPLAIDWIVAAWAVLCSEVTALWLMGFEEYEPSSVIHSNTPLLSRKSRGLLALGTLLLALIAPSYVLEDLPGRYDVMADATALTVGCVLPHPRGGGHPTLSDFVTESATMTAAKILLWPESAVVFHSAEEREAAFALVRDKIRGPYVGVAFEEYVVEDPSHHSSSRTRNGLALIHKDQQPGDEVVQYYKRNLVPFTESFSKIPSIEPPEITRVNLAHPKGIPAPEWDPSTHTRPIPITSSVCLDFASPSAFTNLASRPALILGPARTWTTTVGLSMWDQAKTRANELGSMVLWCDGGSTGVSGVGGGGMHEIMQVGAGSWLRTIAVRYPFDESRTMYVRMGDFTVVAFLLALIGGGVAGNYLVTVTRRGSTAILTDGIAALQRIPFVRRMVGPLPAGPAEADLLGVGGEEGPNLLG